MARLTILNYAAAHHSTHTQRTYPQPLPDSAGTAPSVSTPPHLLQLLLGPLLKALTLVPGPGPALAADLWPPRHLGLEQVPHQEAAVAAAVVTAVVAAGQAACPVSAAGQFAHGQPAAGLPAAAAVDKAAAAAAVDQAAAAAAAAAAVVD